LYRFNGRDGRFTYGYLPALRTVMEGDNYLHQCGAAFALARAARYSGDERHLARARQAVLTLLLATTTDPADAQVRHTALPSTAVNRLGSAGLLVLAINDLPSPAADLLEQSEQLCNYIRRQQQKDGALSTSDLPDGPKSAAADPEAISQYPGVALYGLMLSQRHRPAEWKTELARKAATYYRPWWHKHRSQAFVPWQTAASAEAYLQTKEQPFADFVNEMNDWLCGLQYAQLDASRPLWRGGFMSWRDGKPLRTEPRISSAVYAESLAEACRVARQSADVQRYQRYRETLELCLQFVASLQYGDLNTVHFAEWYRPAVLGGFYASHQDGNLRIDYTQHAVSAMVQYLAHVAEGGK
jgi:hypothetical protein